MGCANSKLNPDGGQVVPLPTRILRKRRNGTNHGTLSEKQLLKVTAFAFDQQNPPMLIHNNSLPDEPHGTTNSSPPQFFAIQDNHADSTINPNATTNHNFKTAADPHHLIALLTKQDQPTEEPTSGNEEEDHPCLICPRSPSFRVYFVEETINDKQNVETKDTGMEDVSPSHDRVESTTCANFREDQVNKMMKKEKKGVSFKRGISKRRPIGVKNLLKVKSCYHIGCSGNDRASLLARKAAA